MDRSPIITTSTAPLPHPVPETAPSQSVPAQNQLFHCLPCARWIATRETDKHLGGKPHRAALEALARKTQAAEKERRKKLAAAPVAAPTVTSGMATKWACAVCQRAMMKISMAGHLSGAPHARMVKAEKEKQAIAVEKERVVAELAEAKQRKEEELRAAKELENQRQREAERVLAEVIRREAERVREIERAAREHRQQVEKEAEQARIKEEKHQEEMAKMAERQREVIREAERKVKQQREQKQQKKKDRKAAQRNLGLESAIGGKSNGTVTPSPQNGDGVGDGFRSRMIEFLQAQEIVKQEDLDSAPVEPVEPVYQELTIEDDQTVYTPPTSIPLRLPMFITSVTDLPPILYRVYDTTSVSQYTSKGFTASMTSMPYDPTTFRTMVDRHANWNSREGTPFVSVTSSPNAARWHITKKESTGLSTTMVGLIDSAALLRVTRVWQMHDAMDYLGLQPSTCERHAYDNEYICAVNIPASTVFACCQPDYYMDMAYVFMKKLERREAAKARPGTRVVVTIRAPDSDAAEAVAQGW